MEISKKIRTLNFKLSKILNWWLFWAYKSTFSGNWMEFSEHREYIFWDHIKNIDWKASSRNDQMFIKKYEEERDLNVLFILDNTSSMRFWSHNKTKKELLEEVFYSLAISAYHNNDNIWWLVFNENKLDFIEHKKNISNIYRLLEILEEKNNTWKEINKFDTIFKYLVNRKIKDNLIFILTDNINRVDEKLIRIASSNNDIIYINIFDILENNLSSIDSNISFNLWNSFLNIDLSDKNKVKEYTEYRNRKINYNKAIFNKNKVWYIRLDTKSDIFGELTWYFSKIIK